MRKAAYALLAAFVWLPPAIAAQSVDAERAQRLYGQACEGGDPAACNVFGLMNETGQGVPQNLERARALYRQACEKGQPVGCTNLGLVYGRGLGVEQDLDLARENYELACNGGDLLGCDLFAATDSAGTSVAAPGDAPSDTGAPRYFKAGHVADTENARGLSDVIVTVPDLGIEVVSDDQGRVELGRLPAGRHVLLAERFGYEPVNGTLDVPGSAEFLVLMNRALMGDPLARGRIEGRIMDAQTDDPLSDVEVAVVDQERARVLSNQQGGFVLRDVRPGLLTVRFSRLGYAPRTTTLVVQPGEERELTTQMSTEAIELPAIDVTANARLGYLERVGLYARQRTAKGTQFMRDDIELHATNSPLHNLLRRAPGILVQAISNGSGTAFYAVNRRVQTGFAAGPANPFARGGPCILPVYLDGVRTITAQIDQIPSAQIEAVEVYSGGDTPIQYAGTNPCGVVLIWTRR